MSSDTFFLHQNHIHLEEQISQGKVLVTISDEKEQFSLQWVTQEEKKNLLPFMPEQRLLKNVFVRIPEHQFKFSKTTDEEVERFIQNMNKKEEKPREKKRRITKSSDDLDLDFELGEKKQRKRRK